MELISRWQISAGEVSEWLPPLLYAAAVVVSAWVLSDARRRGFRLYALALWTLATLLSAHVVFPLYLLTRIFTRKHDATTRPPEASTSHADTRDGDSPAHASSAGDSTTHASSSGGVREQTDDAVSSVAASSAAVSPEEIRAPLWRRKFALPLLYTLTLLTIGALYFYRDYQSFDAHLARAANARLLNRRADAIREYRAALRLNADAHTHKLLAVQLEEDGQLEAALDELRAAERAGGDEDALLPYRIAHLLDALNRRAEADLEYQKFAQGGLCALPPPDARCAEASARVRQR